MAEASSKKAIDALNLASVQRIDPCAVSIIDRVLLLFFILRQAIFLSVYLGDWPIFLFGKMVGPVFCCTVPFISLPSFFQRGREKEGEVGIVQSLHS